ncbi:siderophore-interacting protein [Rhodococcus sp. HNM0569]|uniref:siderophore-interacting protein n=1 Tax=Rhodococcus sp. HNM0569 TaxID=2716340 RepID=UPI00146B7C40|nr:siderophore-interacting protein [Rhodococcus sp. HNM0569]NLU81528.1 siderophore-interacting protein [Rhodococcus sp. HNM0569]
MAKPTATLTVVRTERLAPHLVRVYLGGPGFDSFVPNGFTDAYVKIEFEADGDLTLRTYTIRSVDPVAREIAIDFVVHGDVGIAGPWAANAEPGQTVTVRGPGGAYAPDPSADWYLFAGDETAIPAIAASVEALPADAIGDVVVEVGGADDEIAIAAPQGVTVRWVHRGASSDAVGDDRAGDNAPLVEAVRSIEWRAGDAQVFVHGEAQAVMHNLRPYIRKERGVPAARASISGYWRRGRTEEGFRVWKRELAEAEASA